MKCDEKVVGKNVSLLKKLGDINFEILEKVLPCIKNNLINSDNMYLIVDS